MTRKIQNTLYKKLIDKFTRSISGLQNDTLMIKLTSASILQFLSMHRLQNMVIDNKVKYLKLCLTYKHFVCKC